MDVDKTEDDKGDEISHDHMCPEPGTTDVSDSEEEEDILRRALVDLGVVVDVDGDEDTTAEDGNSCEHPA